MTDKIITLKTKSGKEINVAFQLFSKAPLETPSIPVIRDDALENLEKKTGGIDWEGSGYLDPSSEEARECAFWSADYPYAYLTLWKLL